MNLKYALILLLLCSTIFSGCKSKSLRQSLNKENIHDSFSYYISFTEDNKKDMEASLEYLFSHGANISDGKTENTRVSNESLSPLYFYRIYDNDVISELIKKGFDLKEDMGNGFSAQSSFYDLLENYFTPYSPANFWIRHYEKLISVSFDLNYSLNDNGITPLFVALKNKNYRLARMLMDHGAIMHNKYVKISDDEYVSEASMAVKYDWYDLIRTATQRNDFDPYIKDMEGHNLFEFAIENESVYSFANLLGKIKTETDKEKLLRQIGKKIRDGNYYLTHIEMIDILLLHGTKNVIRYDRRPDIGSKDTDDLFIKDYESFEKELF